MNKQPKYNVYIAKVLSGERERGNRQVDLVESLWLDFDGVLDLVVKWFTDLDYPKSQAFARALDLLNAVDGGEGQWLEDNYNLYLWLIVRKGK